MKLLVKIMLQILEDYVVDKISALICSRKLKMFCFQTPFCYSCKVMQIPEQRLWAGDAGGRVQLYTVLYCIRYCTVYCTVQCTLHCTLYTTLYTVHLTVHCFTLYIVPCTLYSVQYTVYGIHCTLYPGLQHPVEGAAEVRPGGPGGGGCGVLGLGWLGSRGSIEDYWGKIIP